MGFELALMAIYRLLSLAVALAALGILFRERDWRQQLYAAILFIPFALRAAGIK